MFITFFYLSSTLQFLVCSIDVLVRDGLEASRGVVEEEQTGPRVLDSRHARLYSARGVPADRLRAPGRLVESRRHYVSIVSPFSHHLLFGLTSFFTFVFIEVFHLRNPVRHAHFNQLTVSSVVSLIQ